MYDLLSKISYFLSKPFFNVFYSVESIPLIAAFVLGLVGALAPCQFYRKSWSDHFVWQPFHARIHTVEGSLLLYVRENSGIFFIGDIGLELWE